MPGFEYPLVDLAPLDPTAESNSPTNNHYGGGGGGWGYTTHPEGDAVCRAAGGGGPGQPAPGTNGPWNAPGVASPGAAPGVAAFAAAAAAEACAALSVSTAAFKSSICCWAAALPASASVLRLSIFVSISLLSS